MDGFTEILAAVNSGGNAAMIVCVWSLYRLTNEIRGASERLARIEKALSKFLEEK